MVDLQHLRGVFASVSRSVLCINKALARLVFEADWMAQCQERFEAERLSPPCTGFALGIAFRTL